MLETLLGQIKGVLGKTFVLAGLLPATVLLAGWKLYQTRGTNFPETVEGLLQAQSWAIRGTSWLVLNMCWLGLLFFASRSVILYFLREMPGRLLGPLRVAMIRRQTLRRYQAQREFHSIQWSRTVLKWTSDSLPLPDKDTYIPHWARLADNRQDIDAAAVASEDARRIVSGLLRPSGEFKLPSRRQSRKIIDGLRKLYAASFHPLDQYAMVHTEIAEWKTAMTTQTLKLIKRMDCEVFQSESLPRSRFRSFPDEKWIVPTALGNKFASLDDYAEKRYGMDTSTLWKRLWGVLSKEERQDVNESQLSIEVLVNLSLAFLVMAIWVIISSGRTLVQQIEILRFPPTLIRLPGWSTVLFLVVPMVMTMVCYRAAIFAAGGLTEKVIRLVDLRRLQLIGALGFKSPTTVGDEKRMFQILHKFFTRGKALPGDWWLEPAQKGSEKDAA